MLTQSTGLTLQQQAAYRDRGYHFPVRALAADEAADLYSTFLDSCEYHRERMEKLLPRPPRLSLRNSFLPALGLPTGVRSARA
jgi:hypothetical protein